MICSHTLEDLRDPLWVCQEMIRIGRRGYIEVPSRLAETSRGWEHPRLAGLTHHRWLIDIDEARRDIRFLMKFHRIHSSWRLALPASYLRRLPEVETVQWLFWDDTFTYGETMIHGLDQQEAELERFVRSVLPYPTWRLALAHGLEPLHAAGRMAKRVSTRVRKRLGGAS